MVLIAALPRLDLACTRAERASLRVRCNSATPGSQSTLCLDIVRFGPTRGQALVRPNAPGLTDISATHDPSTNSSQRDPSRTARGRPRHVLSSNAPAPGSLGATVAAAAPSQQDPRVAAIQTVIQTANKEQAQALESGDPSVMSNTATTAYYRQLMQTKNGLAAQGATRIELIQLTWGPISIDANTATATTSQTWITTLSDGTTLESTDTNVYSLINQAGTWLIAADMHPVATTPGVGGTPPMTQPTPQAPLPMVPAGQNTSQNWSGYAATAGPYTSVTGTWTVPQPNVAGGSGIGAT